MKVQVAKWGNSTAVRLPKTVVDEMGLKPGEMLELTREGRELRLTSVAKPRTRLQQLLAEADAIGWENQPPLEDWSAVEAPWPDYDENA